MCTDHLIKKTMSQITDTAVNFAGMDGDGKCVSVMDGDGLIFHYCAALYSERH